MMEHSKSCSLKNCLLFATAAQLASVILLLLSSPTSCASKLRVLQEPSSFAYQKYCNDMLADEPSSSMPALLQLSFGQGFFNGGSPRFNTSSPKFYLRRGARLHFTKNATKTEEGRYLVDGSLILQKNMRPWLATFDRPRVFHARHPLQVQQAWIQVRGLWLAHSGSLCVAGCLQSVQEGQMETQVDCEVKVTLHYPAQTSITQPLVKGKLESQRERSDALFFEPIFVTAVSNQPYDFTRLEELRNTCPSQIADVPPKVDVWKDDTAAACHFPWYKQDLDVVWDRQCTGEDCSPFGGREHASRTTLSIQNMVCQGGNIHGFFVFSDGSQEGNDSSQDVLAVEGKWSSVGQLCMTACYLKGAANDSSTVESPDCDILLTLQFPTTLGLLFRYSVIGHVERKPSSPFPPFKRFSFRGHMDMSFGMLGWGTSPPVLQYSYSSDRINEAQNHCEAGSTDQLQNKNKGYRKSKYPDGTIISDLAFQAKLKGSSSSEDALVYFSPISINKRIDRFYHPNSSIDTSTSKGRTDQHMNVSFNLNIDHKQANLQLMRNISSFRLSAEGVYNSGTGSLCLIACRTIQSSAQNAKDLLDHEKDCKLFVSVSYPPTNPGYFGRHGIDGLIVSLRDVKDSLFFEKVSLSSDLQVYREQALSSISQIDLEIVMGIISLTMASIFVGLQLRHAKSHPSLLSQVSLLMLSVLTLGHLIPLVLNFEAIFTVKMKQNILQWNGGWLEVNEVIVRVMTMVVFLLLLRLLQLVWTSKSVGTEGSWYMERRVLYVCLTTYVLGGLIASIVHTNSGGVLLKRMKAYAGVTVDFFLFPQILANYVWGVQDRVLSPPFYLGMTLVRSLPHLYDIVRKYNFVPHLRSRYYYANPNWDFYSYAWDAIIPCGTLVLAVLVFLQQRFGGAFLLPPRWRQRVTYEKVSSDAA